METNIKYYYYSSLRHYDLEAKWVECSKSQYDSIKRAIPKCLIAKRIIKDGK